MALIRCVDCGKEVSDRAKVCPNCGCPIECSANQTNVDNTVVSMNGANVVLQPDGHSQSTETFFSKNKKLIIGVIAAIVAIILIFALIFNGGGFNNDDYGDDYSGVADESSEDSGTESNTDADANTDEDTESDTNANTNTNTNTNTNNTHDHYYTSETTKEATCSTKGVKTFTCSCGDSYTEPISTKSHSWDSATCTSPKKCKVCGATSGKALEHSYYTSGKCIRCGAMDPVASNTLAKCSLSVPSLPKSVNYKSYSGKLYSTVNVTNITYKFEYEGDGTVSLLVYFSGTKTYDYRGAGQSDRCKIGWKLYDANGNVFNTGTFSSPSIAVGESFSNQEDDLIFNFNDAAPGAYRLEILDVN